MSIYFSRIEEDATQAGDVSGFVKDDNWLDESKEFGNQRVLYHSLPLADLVKSLDSNKLLAKSKYLAGPDEVYYGRSLTRDVNFALGWKEGLVLVLDHNSLQYRNKVMPRGKTNYTMRVSQSFVKGTGKREEFLVGDLENLKKHLVGVLISKRNPRANEIKSVLEDNKINTKII